MMAAHEHSEEALELLDLGVGIFDRDLRLAYCNAAFRALRRYPDELCRAGVSLDALLRHNAERGDFGPGDAARQVSERMAEIGASGTRDLEREMADGQVLHIAYRRTRSGGLLITFDDRTAERAAERALRDSEERYSLVSEAAEEAIYDWHIEKKRFFGSPRLREFLGRDFGREGSRGWEWEDIIHPDDLPRYSEALEMHVSGAEQRWSCEYRLRDAAGRWRWVSDHGTSIRGADGRAIRMVAAIRDVSDRVERDAALAASEARLALVTQATSDGVYDWNVVDDVLFVSENLTKLIDLDLTNQSSTIWAEQIHPDDYETYVARLREHFRGEAEAIECDYRLRARGGGYRWVHDRGVGVRGPDRRVTRLVGAVRDITEMREARAEIERVQGRLMGSLGTIADGILLVDPESRVELFNHRYVEIFSAAAGGADLSDLVVRGRDFFEMIRDGYELGMFKPHPNGVDAWIDARRQAWEKPVANWELELANGSWILLNERRMPDGGRVSVYTDITEFKRREAEAQAARQRFEEAIEAISSGFALWDSDDRLVISNMRYRRYFSEIGDLVIPGAAFNEIIRAGIERGHFPLAAGNVEAYVAGIAERRLKANGEPREQLIGGLWLQITDHRTTDGGIVSIYTDITQHKRAEEALKAALAEFNAVLDSIDYGVLFMGPDLRARIVNRAFGRIWNIPQEFIDRRPTMQELIEYNRDTGVYAVAPEDWDRWVADRVRGVSAGDIPPGEFVRGDGRVLSYQCVGLADGGRMLTYFDITELKQREADIARARDTAETALADLRKAQERLVQSEKMASLGQLTAGIAHEIKNPLNFVNNFAKLSHELLGELTELLEGPIASLDEGGREDAEDLLRTVRENLGKINEHGRRADSIVKNMLLHSREGPSERQRVALNPIAEEAMNLAYHGARAEDPGFNIEIVRSIDPAVGEVDCYPQELMRVFLNLITNGMYAARLRKSGEPGAFVPTISLTTRRANGAVEIEVRDNGTGIPPEVKEKIFLPFFTTKPAGQGTGLGLSLSYDIVVKQHGGTLSVDSEPGDHTAFVVSLPAVMGRG